MIEAAITPEQEKALAAVDPDLRARLEGDGVSTAWLAERLGRTPRALTPWLRSIGARKSYGGLWRLPNPARVFRSNVTI